MRWYGWILLLTNHLMPAKAASDLKQRGIVIESESPKNYRMSGIPSHDGELDFTIHTVREAFTKEGFDAARLALFATTDDAISCYLKAFDDVHRQAVTGVCLRLDADGIVLGVGILSHPDWVPVATAQVHIDVETGLAQIDPAPGLSQQKEAILVKHMFAAIRDFYHQHIYTASTDFALRPVLASNEPDAVHGIFLQYCAKIVDYHRSVKDGCAVIASGRFGASRRALLDLVDHLSSARGEMVYAVSFARRFALPLDARETIEDASRSFEILKDRVEMMASCRSEASSHLTNIVALLVTFFGTYFVVFRESISLWWSVIISAAATTGVGALLVVVEWFTTKRRMQG